MLDTSESNPFHSFWMAGFECTDKLNVHGNRVDFINLTGHLKQMDEDYQALSLFNIKTVREGIRWSVVEKQPYVYDWSVVEQMIRCGQRNGIQQLWDICHFGFPDDLTPLHPHFAPRFAALCKSFVQFYRSIDATNTLIVTPFNEVGFLSWLGGEACGTTPYCRRYGWQVKYALMKAYIKGIEVLKAADPGIRILTTEPLVNMVPKQNATEEEKRYAADIHELQFQVLEMLSGRLCPELGGKPEYLDLLGFNFYYNNQWIVNEEGFLPWANEGGDERWQPLSYLLEKVHQRYQRPILLTETSHPAEDRPNWINFIAEQCGEVVQKGIPLLGICWYPIIDRPDWDHLTPWHQSGIWDVVEDTNGHLQRVLHQPSANALHKAQVMIRQMSTEMSIY